MLHGHISAAGDAASTRVTELEQEVLALRQEMAHLTQALGSARMIGTAIGIVMLTDRVSQQAAFEELSRLSQRRNEKLRDVAEQIVFTGEIPGR